MAWNKLYPLDSTGVSASVSGVRDNWQAIETIFDAEHYTFTETTSGYHRPGRMGSIWYVPEANKSLMTTADIGTGGLVYSSNYGVLWRWNGSAWKRITEDYFSRVSVHNDPTDLQTLTTGVTAELDLTDSDTSGWIETYDGMGEFSTNQITIACSGYYLVISRMHLLPAATPLCTMMLTIQWYDFSAAAWFDREYHRIYGVKNELYPVLQVAAIRDMVDGDKIRLIGYQNSGSNMIVSEAYLYLTRLS